MYLDISRHFFNLLHQQNEKIISFSESVEIEMNTFQMNFRFSLHPELILKSQLYNWLPVMLVLFSTVPSKWKPLQLVLLIEMNVKVKSKITLKAATNCSTYPSQSIDRFLRAVLNTIHKKP